MASTTRRPGGPAFRRALDISVGAWTIGALLPAGLLIAAAIRLESPGPPMYGQIRVGLDRSGFRLYKFRSMRHGCPDYPTKSPEDDRITRVGRFLRRFSLDELPQMYNLVMGDMTLVGPRPELLSLLPSYSTAHFRRFDVPPGLTGLWQVSGRSNLSLGEKLELDLQYVTNRSIRLDARILIRTPRAVLGGNGAY
ncbi:MAG TPA: sugar transferase [Chloroflexota bacterium]|nr:sugar transferase [Chloroflexota bacterium]